MRILLVEDEKRMAQALCEILRLEKYDVDHCDNGADGLDAIESNIYDIVILDVMLPGMSGFRAKIRHFPYIKQNSIAEIVSTMESFLASCTDLDISVETIRHIGI